MTDGVEKLEFEQTEEEETVGFSVRFRQLHQSSVGDPGESPIPSPSGFRAGLFDLSSVYLASHGVGVPARRSVIGRVR